MTRKLLPNACPKPKPAPEKPWSRSSIREPSYKAKLALLRDQPPRKAIKKKRRTKTEDHRIYGPQAFRDFLHAYRCLGCGYRGEAIEQAHIHTGGKGRKDSYKKTAPLCGPRMIPTGGFTNDGAELGYGIEGCHHDYDAAKQSWPASRGIDIEVEQDRFWSEYEDHCETLGIDP